MVGDCVDDLSMKLSQEDMAQKSFGVEIFVCKVGATQILVYSCTMSYLYFENSCSWSHANEIDFAVYAFHGRR